MADRPFIAPPVLRSPLQAVFERLDGPERQATAGLLAAEWPGIACVVVRGRADDKAFMSAVAPILDLALPIEPSTFSATRIVTALWMSPDEWWLLMPRSRRDDTLRQLVDALDGVHAQVVDVSGSVACLRLAGPRCLTVLRHLSPYDVERITVGRCVSTTVPKATITIVRVDSDGVVLLFRRSFAPWIWSLIERSARPYGLARCSPEALRSAGRAAPRD